MGMSAQIPAPSAAHASAKEARTESTFRVGDAGVAEQGGKHGCWAVFLFFAFIRLFLNLFVRTTVDFALTLNGCVFRFRPFCTHFDRFSTASESFRENFARRVCFREASIERNPKMFGFPIFSKRNKKHWCWVPSADLDASPARLLCVGFDSDMAFVGGKS